MVNIKSKNLLVLIVEVEGNDPKKVLRELEEKINIGFFSKSGDIPFLVKAKKGTSVEVIEEVMTYLVEKGFTPLFVPQEGESGSTSQSTETIDLERIGGNRVMVINRTVRAGQLIEYPGDIFIWGDVNPDAEIRAAGNVIVFGELRGIAWAGYPGNKEAVIVALKMKPQQLRIANIFAPGEKNIPTDKPVIAKVVENEGDYEIEIEPLK